MENSMKKVLTTLLLLIVLAGIVFIGFRLINVCSTCDKHFVGLGYEGNSIDTMINEEEPQILCEDCAKTHHALSLLTGKELDEFKRVLVPGKLIPGEIRFGTQEEE